MTPLINPPRAVLAHRLASIPVLIVDPDMPIANLVRNVLRSVGFENVRVAKDGKDALDILLSSPVDLLITDWRMEHMDGVSLLRFLRSDPNSPNRFVPIIMLTGRAERRDVEEARDAGVTEYMVKPVTAKALFERIVQVVENPRSFILAKAYKGPDRRRGRDEAPTKEERRLRKPKAGSIAKKPE